MDPTTGYCGPGPERTLRSVWAVAGTARAAPAESSSAAPAPSNFVFIIMVSSSIGVPCELRTVKVETGPTGCCSAICRTLRFFNARPCGGLWLTLRRHNPAGPELHHGVTSIGLAEEAHGIRAAAAGRGSSPRAGSRLPRNSAFHPGRPDSHTTHDAF